MPMRFFSQFLRSQYFSGIFLIFTTVLALVIANSPLQDDYHALLHAEIGFVFDSINMKISLKHWINDGLMALFFLLVGLEIKRELLQGELSSPGKAALPFLCAVGGVIAPALIFLLINKGHPINWNGWGVPIATDIAFALGLLALGGKTVPLALKVFLTALAIIDDLIAIVVIALFYGEPLNIDAFFLAVMAMFILFAMNLMHIRHLWAYLVMGFVLWFTILQSGLHATLAGVLLAVMIPIGNHKATSPLHRLEEMLHPVSAYIIVPVFALANAGLSFAELKFTDLVAPLPLGIMAGLFFGKQIGIVLAAYISIKMRWARLPNDVDWTRFYAVALLAGVGFTMSLFIGTLAFKLETTNNEVRLGVMCGSLLSGLLGLALLRFASKSKMEKLSAETQGPDYK
jgi:NhaA family Na+:H+ antiporter